MLRSAFRLSARSPALARAPLLGRVAELSSSLVPTAPAALEQLPPNDPLASSLNAALLRSVSDALVAAPPPELSATQATEGELMHWCLHALGLKEHTAREYVDAMLSEGFDSPAALSTATAEELSRHRIRTGHARLMLNKLAELHVAPPPTATAIPPPRLFDYQTIVENVTVSDAVDSVEAAFAKLAAGKVDVPFPMHIGINETATAGPGGPAGGSDTQRSMQLSREMVKAVIGPRGATIKQVREQSGTRYRERPVDGGAIAEEIEARAAGREPCEDASHRLRQAL